ncbi:PREDICTED: uncharacterized protein C2orf78-like [Chinchilla lanigera]|uniref:uncharacterized protein C2orf78-like n=1 Tax=Chinchilla lanigera TaxID=34839 RepID=UPI000696D2AF|nr:PREDICTED: uncharacterized protein C2orf78-like [Chinchilla lanigera]
MEDNNGKSHIVSYQSHDSSSSCHDPTSLIQRTPPPHIPNQVHRLHLAYQQGSQVFYNNQSAAGPLPSGQLGLCMKPSGCACYRGEENFPRDRDIPRVASPKPGTFKHPVAIKTQDTGVIEVNQVQENSGVTKGSLPPVRKNKQKSSWPITGAPEAKTQLKAPESLLRGEELIFSAEANNRAHVNTAELSTSKTSGKTPSRITQRKYCGQARTRENKSKKMTERKQLGPKLIEEKPSILNLKLKTNRHALGQEAFKMPPTFLGKHMLESVQVFHPLGKKTEKRAGNFLYRALRTPTSSKDPKSLPTSKPWKEAPCERKGPESAPERSENQHISAEAEDSSASLCELPPPWKVKIIPLGFPSPEKPQARPVSRRAQRPALRRPTAAHPAAYPAAADGTAQPSQLAAGHTSLLGPGKPAQPVLENAKQPRWTISKQPWLSQSATRKPAPQETAASASLRRGPVATVVGKRRPLPQPQHPFLLQDFSRQPIPWREPNVPEPVMSSPIVEEQRPEREALKRQAQREREVAAKCTSLGKLQFFRQREKDREIEQCYGYAR